MKSAGLGTGLLAKRAILSEPFRRFASNRGLPSLRSVMRPACGITRVQG